MYFLCKITTSKLVLIPNFSNFIPLSQTALHKKNEILYRKHIPILSIHFL